MGYSLVEADLLNQALFVVASAIRMKGGTEGLIPFNNLYGPGYGFANAVMTLPSSGMSVKTGTVTFSSTQTEITITPQNAPGKPFFAVLCKKTPVYNQNGVNMVFYLGLPVFVDMNQNSWAKSSTDPYFVSVAESRPSYDGFSTHFAATASGTGLYANGQMVFRPRNNSYPFFAGEYVWVAVYGEVYGND